MDNEIQAGENVMRCRAAGCETVWVSLVSIVFSILSASMLIDLTTMELFTCSTTRTA
jgi:hypothetical protein